MDALMLIVVMLLGLFLPWLAMWWTWQEWRQTHGRTR